MGDLDRDGRLDIVQANGMVDDSYDKKYGNCPDYWYWNEKIALTGPDVHGYADRWADLRGRCIFPKELNRLYLNQGNYFVDVGQQVGWTKAGNSRGVALVDLDNDGDLDVLITHQFAPLSIYRNEGNANSWLGLQLEGNGKNCNRDALGSKIVVTYPQGRTSAVQIREITASNGLSAQGDRRILFGLAGFQGTVTVKIHWCGNQATQLIRLQPDRYYKISQES